MLSKEFLTELQNLSRNDKWQVMSILVEELAKQEQPALEEGKQYEIWSPFDAAGAAETLLKMLEEDKQARHG